MDLGYALLTGLALVIIIGAIAHALERKKTPPKDSSDAISDHDVL